MCVPRLGGDIKNFYMKCDRFECIYANEANEESHHSGSVRSVHTNVDDVGGGNSLAQVKT